MFDTWINYNIRSNGDGTFSIDFETNDDDDDGYEDGEIVTDTYHHKTFESAIKFTGLTRTGAYGQPITVSVEGTVVHTMDEALKAKQ